MEEAAEKAAKEAVEEAMEEAAAKRIVVGTSLPPLVAVSADKASNKNVVQKGQNSIVGTILTNQVTRTRAHACIVTGYARPTGGADRGKRPGIRITDEKTSRSKDSTSTFSSVATLRVSLACN
ncbi:hypothetical protein G5I_13288 [Acromyrmex echinatior]|uniref:Uncharacterized protein n=1 Tax=Acromyrmex echinatior TaxID=103372 RepID=F4X4M2_ACREC|nr:hypothetical protein G5I_13288 [Acromyrmex echinatior]